MSLLSLLAPTTSNSHNLAIFICHLFIGGSFRFGQILYDPKVFDGHLTTEIGSVCSVEIPWQTIDVTQPPSLAWNVGERTDHILQLIFLDPTELSESISKFGVFFTFYRVFVFSAISNKIELRHQISVISRLNPILNSSPLILHYDSHSSFLNIHLTIETNNITEHLINQDMNTDKDQNNSEQHFFDDTFGMYEQMQPVALNVPMLFKSMSDYRNHKARIPNLGHNYYANYFFSSLNATYINMTCTLYNKTTGGTVVQLLKHKEVKYYKELALEYEFLSREDVDHLSGQHINKLHFNAYVTVSNNKQIKTHSLYPHTSMKLIVMFVYGTDIHRRVNVLRIPITVKVAAFVIILFMVLAAFILRKMREKLNLRRADFVSSVLDILIAFIACGNIRSRHTAERWFFAVLLIGAFFMVPIFISEFLNEVYRMQNQKIDTFEKLAEIRSPVYFNPVLTMQQEIVREMLSKKMGPNMNYQGIRFNSQLVTQHHKSFIYVGEAYRIEIFRATFKSTDRDFDVVDEILGSVNQNFYVQSDHYVPDRMLDKINKMTMSIIENGLQQFYATFNTFQRKLFERDFITIEDDIQALRMSQLKRPMIVLIGLWALAIIVFIAEKITFKWKNRVHSAP